MSSLDEKEKRVYLSSLDAWREELKTNKHQMKRYANRIIESLEKEIRKRWPEAI